ncbi:DUF5060 domain-containing protein [Acuticoccus sp. M5D2P5]|uniref:DUF5060 domain-containing protein n=1 Tax=Acuticoccus kalidii TaxID=2910977 RepID=UPI001F1B5D6D|nr:DUF5060 domain-containing protein [Acuticoccus kalidii]MCF3934849.1 DUF5060 domain-containing protein [Acuticoccus kalidii]
MTNATVARWDIFEHTMQGPAEGNPYLDVTVGAVFRHGNRTLTVPGFYDGNGVYKVRFSPDTEGEWHFSTTSDVAALDGASGTFVCGPARPGVRGPVRVHNQFHFAYEDGTVYLPFGTTCYAWTHQPLDLQEQTLETLKTAPFNKVRMGVFPKDYIYNTNDPLHDVFEKKADGTHDMDRPGFEAFRHFENQVGTLAEMGIEADIIIFHPYDRWGYCTMTEEQDNRYLRYLVARLAAYRNVWWSLANEYDFLLDTKPMERWDTFFRIIEENDPSQHLKSIHNGDPAKSYNHRRPWVDHCCIQNWEVKKTAEWREEYGKPVINDEPEYEGNVPKHWGNCEPHELVNRYWITMVRGGYIGHGETFMRDDDVLWWAKGGTLEGQSVARIAFIREIMEDSIIDGLTPVSTTTSRVSRRVAMSTDGDTRFIYWSEHQPLQWDVGLPEDDGDYEIDLIDVWNMTVTPLPKGPNPRVHSQRISGGGTVSNVSGAAFGVELPGKPYLALRVRPRRTGKETGHGNG